MRQRMIYEQKNKYIGILFGEKKQQSNFEGYDPLNFVNLRSNVKSKEE